MATIVSSIRGLRNLLPYEKILEVLHISHDEYNAITTSIDNSPDKTDEDIAEEILGYTDD